MTQKKKKAGQTGIEQNQDLRTLRFEIRLSPGEYNGLVSQALLAEGNSLAQYARNKLIYGGNAATEHFRQQRDTSKAARLRSSPGCTQNCSAAIRSRTASGAPKRSRSTPATGTPAACNRATISAASAPRLRTSTMISPGVARRAALPPGQFGGPSEPPPCPVRARELGPALPSGHRQALRAASPPIDPRPQRARTVHARQCRP